MDCRRQPRCHLIVWKRAAAMKCFRPTGPTAVTLVLCESASVIRKPVPLVSNINTYNSKGRDTWQPSDAIRMNSTRDDWLDPSKTKATFQNSSRSSLPSIYKIPSGIKWYYYGRLGVQSFAGQHSDCPHPIGSIAWCNTEMILSAPRSEDRMKKLNKTCSTS